MQSIEAKVQVGDDRRVTLQLPESLPQGEYKVMLIWNPADREAANDSETSREDKAENSLTERWQKWFAQVDELPLHANPDSKSFHQHLVEEHRKQGLEL